MKLRKTVQVIMRNRKHKEKILKKDMQKGNNKKHREVKII